ncbi:hypothetical protein BR93DRAFT_295005 [Coniochaeta sp. PMI_546]|nr:hypothetical protein BR93DRAFT_295005 [Coniochaeta sp. PMI_546]
MMEDGWVFSIITSVAASWQSSTLDQPQYYLPREVCLSTRWTAFDRAAKPVHINSFSTNPRLARSVGGTRPCDCV